MLRRLLPIVATLLAALTLAGCVAFPTDPIRRPFFYDVRDVSVIANEQVPLALTTGVDQRVSAAIKATERRVATERVVLTVKIESYRAVRYLGDRRALARFKVTAADVVTGNPVAAGSFLVRSNTDNPDIAIQALADEIAARIRFSFALQTPSLVRVVKPKPRTSTRLKTDYVTEETIAPDATFDAFVQKPDVSVEVVKPTVRSGTNLEDGANASISLSPAPKVETAAPKCASNDPACKP